AGGWKNAAHLTQAAGFGCAARIARDDVVVLASFRDRTVEAGEFHNGVNFAGVFRAPVVFLCRTIAPPADVPAVVERGVAYGVPAVLCDGGDARAVLDAVRAAAERARGGGGPTLIEARIERAGADAGGDAD